LQSLGSPSVPLREVDVVLIPRLRTHIGELDALLGDGFVPGSSVLVIGAPGAGKSTLILQILKRANLKSLYVTGEESVQQVKLRADRLRLQSPKLLLLFETQLSKVLGHINGLQLNLLVIDSIQTLYSGTSSSLPGSATQIRTCTYALRRIAQEKKLVLLLIGQVTKEKKLAGPKLIEHAVDVVLHLEVDPNAPHRRLLFASKNRFGSVQPRCLLYMRKTGLAFRHASP
jgi:DNA repair protein RadA/Sms